MKKKNKLLLFSIMFLTVIGGQTLEAESWRKNYVNQCSDPGFGGCPTISQPYQVPNSNQLTPHPNPVLVPKMLPILQPRQILAPEQNKGQVHNYHNIPEFQKAPDLKPILKPIATPVLVPRMEPKPQEEKVPGFAKTIGAPGDLEHPGEPTPLHKENNTPQPKDINIVEQPKIIQTNNHKKNFTKIKNNFEKITKKEKQTNYRKINKKNNTSKIYKKSYEPSSFQYVRGCVQNNTNNIDYSFIFGFIILLATLIIII